MSAILEINERPKSVTIERLSKGNKWILVRKFYNPDGYSTEELIAMCEQWNAKTKQHIRICNGAHWQILTTKMLPFYQVLGGLSTSNALNANNIVFSVKTYKKPEATAKDAQMQSDAMFVKASEDKNYPVLMTFKEFVKWFRITSKNGKGFAKATKVKGTEADNWLVWFKLYTESGELYSVAPFVNRYDFKINLPH